MKNIFTAPTAEDKRILEFKVPSIIFRLNLDYEPDDEELLFILNKVDELSHALESIGFSFGSIEAHVYTPYFCHIFEREMPVEQDVPAWEEDDEDFIVPGDEDYDTDEDYSPANPHWRQ